ncbi:Polypyrimidine tract-binding protein-like 3 [Vitis vinifera]|uniref:Polypyrimidine tract-binding protein-like 3 n=1 Tax=Vitis vinifera TaxID=29760 RepID=A0A438KKA7_VITVI|nr:Polypyrimidine tract-binding protein-like 3 [Vitis vinifera]
MTEPSKVIHVRNVGPEISENDLLQLVHPFGVVTKLVMLRAKNQALLQMQDVASAVSALQYYANVQPSVRGRNVYVQFSSHQELTTMDQNSQGRKGDQVGYYSFIQIDGGGMRRGGTPSRFESLWLKVEGLRDLIKTGVWDMLSEEGKDLRSDNFWHSKEREVPLSLEENGAKGKAVTDYLHRALLEETSWRQKPRD